MNWGSIFVSLLTPVFLSLMVGFARRPVRKAGDYHLIAYSLPAKIIAALAVASCVLLIFVATRAPEKERTAAMICCGGIAVLLFFMPLEIFFREILFNEKEIILSSFWVPTRRISWNQVSSFQHFPEKKEWILIDVTGRKFQPSYFLQGVRDLYEEARRQGKAQ